MLKKCRPLLSALLALLLLIGSIPLSAAGENAESAVPAENLSAAALQQADAMQVEHVFTSLSQWRDYLTEKNQAHQESDLSHESIQQAFKAGFQNCVWPSVNEISSSSGKNSPSVSSVSSL